MSAEHLPIELLSAHLDGEATAAERARVEAHLAGCDTCRATLEDLRRIAAASAKLAVPEPPEGLRERIAASVAPPVAKRRAWLGAAASLAAVGLVATAWYLQGPEGTVPAPQLGTVRAPAQQEAAGLAEAPVPAPPAPAPAPPRPRAKVREESRPDTGNVPARKESLEKGLRETLPSDEKRGADSGFAMDRKEGVRPEQAGAIERMARVSAPSALAGPDDGPVPGIGFVEVAAEGDFDRAALLDALGAIGVSPAPATDDRTIELVVPRVRWAECREVLKRFEIRIDETKVRALPGDAIGIRIRTSAP